MSCVVKSHKGRHFFHKYLLHLPSNITNTMKKLSLFFLALLIALQVFPQVIAITSYDIPAESKTLRDNSMIVYKGNLLAFWYQKLSSLSKLSLSIHDAQNYQLKASMPWQIKSRPELDFYLTDTKEGLAPFALLNNNLYALNICFMSKEKAFSLFAQKLDEKGAMLGDLVKLGETPFKSHDNFGRFYSTISADSSKLLLIERKPMASGAQSQVFGIAIFDENMKELKRLDIEIPMPAESMSVGNFMLDENGFVYLMALLQEDKAKKTKGKLDMYVIDSDSKEIKQIPIQFPGKDIVSASIRYNSKIKKSVLAGTYIVSGEKKNSYSSSGIFYIKYDPFSGESSDKAARELVNPRYALNEQRALIQSNASVDMYMKRLVSIDFEEDGSEYLTFEHRENSPIDHSSIYGDIVDVHLAQDGYIQEAVVIRKHQTEYLSGTYGSFILLKKDRRRFFIFNDVEDNYKKDNGKKAPQAYERLNELLLDVNMVLAQAVIEPNGICKQNLLYNKKEYTTIIHPLLAYPQGDSRSIVSSHSVSDKYYTFSVISIKE